MCAIVLKVKYRAASEPDIFIPFDSEEAAETRIAELMRLETVASVKLFRPWRVLERTESWSTREL